MKNLDEILEKEYSVTSKNRNKYKTEISNVLQNDPRIKIFDEIYGYILKHKDFDTYFFMSCVKFIDKHGYITPNQFNGLVNIYYGFGMDRG